MSIKELYWILATWYMRLPYWFIALVVVAFIVLLFTLLIMWKKKERYNRLYKNATSNLKQSNKVILDVTSKYSIKEEEIVKLKEAIATSKKQIREKDGMIKTLNRKNSVQETSLNERNEQYRICESEKSVLLSKLQAKEENIEKLKGAIILANEETLKIGKGQKQLESLKALLEKEIDELKATIKQQADAYKTEIRNLNLKVGGRDEEIEKMSEALAEVQKELQTVRNEKSIVENQLQNIQEIQMKKSQITDNDLNIIEKLAKW